MSHITTIRRALFSSIISLLLCFAMLAGSTFAWFSAVITSENNVIQAGTLDVELSYKEPGASEYKDASRGAIFNADLWEPGCIDTKIIRIANKGNLALQYQLNFSSNGEPEQGKPNLAEVIDVYIFDANETVTLDLIQSSVPVGTLADAMNTSNPLVRGVILPEGSSGTHPTGYVEYCFVLAMREGLGKEYQNLTVGDGVSVRLVATQYNWESDSFDNNYDQIGGTVVTRQLRLLPNVLTDLPESALAAAPGVNFGGSPYAYTDTSLFSGKHITRIGIPVKSVQAIDENQTFTLSVVKTTSDPYVYVSQNVLTLPVDQLGSSTTVNKWIYVDVDIQLAEDETLAFGMPTDTVEWGYYTTKNTQYAFRSASGSWTSPINHSILFDVYATETLVFRQTEYGFAAITKGNALPSVLADFPESAIASGNDVEFTNPPYSYLNQDLFAGAKITRIGIPVKRVAELDENQTFTLSVIKQGSGEYQYVSQHVLTLPLDQLGDSTTVNKWIYVDLDIQLAEDETLAFGGKNDTVIWAWKSGFANTTYAFRDARGGSTKGIFFDIQTEKVLTYEDYLEQQKEEQDRVEAEREQERRDAQLKEILSGKGISILGDSISTYQGWSNNTSYNSTIGSNAVYYTGSRDNFATVSETWWMQTITRSGLELVVNNSWSGDAVTNLGVSRALQLHNNSNREPDIIAVYLGINDFRRAKTVEEFETKYDEMISGMLRKYVGKDVYLFTLVYTTNLEKSGINPDDVVKFNKVIGDIAAKYGCTLVDLYNDTGITKDNLATYMGDGNLRPNYLGMDRITQCFMDALMKKYVTDVVVSDLSYIGENQYNISPSDSEPTLKLSVAYSNGIIEEVAITEDMYVVEGDYTIPDFQTAGSYQAKVSYKGTTTTFNLEIVDPDAGILIKNEEFLYGSYFDHDRTGVYTRITTGDYAKIKSADALHPAQDITIKVEDTSLDNYKVTLGYYDKDGNYTGRTGILDMTDGELTIKASEMNGGYFRVNVYIYNGRFTKVPDSAKITVYGKDSSPDQSDTPDSTGRPWEGKKITIVGDSISTGGYTGMLANMSGATIQNLSASGLRLAGGLTGKVSGIDADADLVIIFGGTNDYWHKTVNIGDSDSTDATTYVGALRYILNYLRTNNPNAQILFIFPPDQTFGGNPSSTDFGKGTLDDFRAAFLNFCNENDVPYINLGDTDFDSSIHSGDGVHPNTAGHQIIAEAIYDMICSE